MKQIYTQQVIENLSKNETQLGPENDRIMNEQVLLKERPIQLCQLRQDPLNFNNTHHGPDLNNNSCLVNYC